MTSVTASIAERPMQLRLYKMVSIDEDVAGEPSGATWYSIDSNKRTGEEQDRPLLSSS